MAIFKDAYSDERVTAAARAREEIRDALILRLDYWGEADEKITEKEREKVHAIMERRIEALIRNNNLEG